MNVHIRDAVEADMAAILEIYTPHVLYGLSTFEEVPPSVDEMITRFATVKGLDLPYLVAELDAKVVGYAYATLYRPRAAYRHTIEDSVYVASGLNGRGVGATLLSALIARCEEGPWRQMLAVIGKDRWARAHRACRRLELNADRLTAPCKNKQWSELPHRARQSWCFPLGENTMIGVQPEREIGISLAARQSACLSCAPEACILGDAAGRPRRPDGGAYRLRNRHNCPRNTPPGCRPRRR